MKTSGSEPLKAMIDSYDAGAPLEDASTIPASWYTDSRVNDLEAKTVFSRSWQMIGRADQVKEPGQYVAAAIAGEPVVAVRGNDGKLRAFFNVCRHHAAEVMTQPCGKTNLLRCPYHGWTYSLEGELKGTPDFGGVRGFEKEKNGLVAIDAEIWENWLFVRLDPGGPSLSDFLGAELIDQCRPLAFGELCWMERRHYLFDCNWKVFVDNYLDGGYHVPHLHKGLDSVLDYGRYSIENGQRFCLQKSPVVAAGAEPETGAVRRGEWAYYYWIYPNFMVNWYEGVMDTNLVLPVGADKTEVIFDFYFSDVTTEEARRKNIASINVGQRIQDEDTAICKSVQAGLNSRAYRTGRLSVRREAGEHLFHRLLARDLASA